VIASCPELQERGWTRLAAVADALAGALRHLGVQASSARLLANIGVAIFQSGFDRWVDSPDSADLAARISEAAAELTGAVTPHITAQPAGTIAHTRRRRRLPGAGWHGVIARSAKPEALTQASLGESDALSLVAEAVLDVAAFLALVLIRGGACSGSA
jgi:hypothetical protein